jgi:streptogrisin C
MRIKSKILIALLAVLALLWPAAGAQARPLSGSEVSLVRTINSARTSRGLAPLRVDFRLVRAARGHTADMLRRQYFAHGSVSSRARAAGARGPIFGENLAWATGLTAQWVIDKWLASPSHRAVMLRPGFRRVGVGIAFGTFAGRGGAGIVTADFAGT